MVVPQYFTIATTDEGKKHAEWHQLMLVKALERLIMETTHDSLNELGID